MIVVEIASGRIRVIDARDRKAAPRAEWSAPLPDELLPTHEATLGSWLKKSLQEAKLNKGDAQVLLGRGIVTLKSVRVPVVPSHELPPMVAFALESSGTADTVIDFQSGPVVASSTGEPELEVLTASIPKDRLDTIRKVLSLAGLSAKRMTVRSLGLRPWIPVSEQTEAIVYLSEDGPEISIWSGESLRLCRWVTPPKGATPPDRLANELRRTLASFHAEAPAEEVSRLRLLGEGAASVAPILAQELGMPAETIETANLPASALAMLGTVEPSFRPAVDFLSPKRAVVGTNQTRVRVLAGALVAILAAGAAYAFFQREAGSRDAQIAILQSELTQLTQQVKELKPITDRHQIIREWIESGDPLLDELQEIAAQLPDTSDLFLTGLEYNAGQNKQPGTIKLDGLSRDQSIVTRAQTTLAGRVEGRYDIVPRGLDPGADVGPFVWRFGLDLGFDPLSLADYAQRAEQRSKTLEALKPPPDMVRQELSLARTPTAATSSKNERKEARQAAKAESSEGSSGSDLLKKKVDELRKLPPDKREEALAKEKKFLQKRLRQELQKEGP